MAIDFSLNVVPGATFRQRFEWRDGAMPVDLTGWHALAHFRLTRDNPVVLVELSTDNGGIVLGGALGTIDLYASAADTLTWTFASGFWDISLKDTNGEIYPPLVAGKVQIIPMVTKWP